MVFMNCENNPEPDAFSNFREIAGIGSAVKVNVLVEMGQPKSHYTSEAEGWSGVLRLSREGTRARSCGSGCRLKKVTGAFRPWIAVARVQHGSRDAIVSIFAGVP